MKTLIFSIFLSFGFIFNSVAQSDNCATATFLDLSSGNACSVGTTVGATSTNTLWGGCNPASVNEVWYTYISNGAANSWSVASLGITETELIVLTGGCGGQLELCATATGTNTVTSNWGIASGTQVWVGVMSNAGTEGSFDLCIDSNDPPPVGGSTCAQAIPVCDLNATTTIDMSTIGPSGAFPSCFLASVNSDVWIEFTVTTSGVIEWDATPTGVIAGVELDWAMYDVTAGCPGAGGTEVACNYHFSGAIGAPNGMQPWPNFWPYNLGIACPIAFNSGFLGFEYCAPITVTAGNTYAIVIDYFTGGATGTLDFSFGPGTTASLDCAFLPIELASFDGEYDPNLNQVNLNWMTVSELNNDFFTIERSADGYLFKEIAQVKGSGTSTKPINYSHIDDYNQAGIVYYRLKQTDYDGTEVLSSTIAVKISRDEQMSVQPNPFEETCTIGFQSAVFETGSIEVITNDGTVLLNKTISINPGSNHYNLNLVGINSGLYSVVVKTPSTVVRKNVIKQ